MRIAATIALIAIAATSAGCGGGSSSSTLTALSATRTATQATTAPTTATTAPRTPTTAGSQSTPSRTKTAGRSRTTTATTAPSGKGHSPQTVPARLVDQPLDVAERILRNARISYKAIPLHGHVSGPASQWGVCETTPPAGKRVPSAGVGLIVLRAKCGAR